MRTSQVFERTVHGGVAGRDVVNIDLGDLTEHEAQARFYRYTRIDCTKAAREQLIFLAEQHDFQFSDLRHARRAGCLHWSKKHKVWTATSRWLDYGAAVMFFLFGGALSVPATALIWRHMNFSNALGGTLVMACALVALTGLLARTFVVPHRTAHRAVDILSERVELDVPKGHA